MILVFRAEFKSEIRMARKYAHPPQLSLLAVIRTASDDSCGGGLGTRLGQP